MNRIILDSVYLLNWYGFVNKKIPVGNNLSLITGENECGKSTILDAIKYAFIGDTEFNKATSTSRIGIGKRTLASYTRCLIDPDTGKCARNNQTHPNVHTYIALQYFNELYHKKFVLGVVIDTNASDDTTSSWFCFEDKIIEDITFLKKENNAIYALGSKEFRDTNRCELMNGINGITKFMTMTGLKLQGEQINKYKRKLRNIMTYNPEAKIQQFIKESVLEAKSVDLTKLKNQKKSIDELSDTFNALTDEINELDQILKLFEDYQCINYRLQKDNVKRVYKQLVSFDNEMSDNHHIIESNNSKANQLAIDEKRLSQEKESKSQQLIDARIQQEKADGYQALKDEKNKLTELNHQTNYLNDQFNQVKQCYLQLHEYTDQVKLDVNALDYADVQIDSQVKAENLNQIRQSIKKYYDQIYQTKVKLELSKEEVQKEILACQEIIKTCDQNLPDYSKVASQMGLLKEINAKFKQMGIDYKAKFASAYVVALKDEKWRNAIETFLGIHRYAIVVEPNYFYIANEVMDKSKYKYVELINTPLLMGKSFEIVDDSLLHQLSIKNEIAKKYYAYWLGKIHAVAANEVANYENAIASNGKISRNMSLTYLNFKKIDSYCLGEDAIQLNREKAVQEKLSYQQKEQEILNEYQELMHKLTLTDAIQRVINRDYDMTIAQVMQKHHQQIHECNARIQELEVALKQNNEYLLLVERISLFEKELAQLSHQYNQTHNALVEIQLQTKSLQSKNESLIEQLKNIQNQWNEHCKELTNECMQAKVEYDNFIAKNKSTGDVMVEDSRRNVENELRKAEQSLASAQGAYNAKKNIDNRLSEGVDKQIEYARRKQRLEVDNLELIKGKLQQQMIKYESIFKNEFVMKIKANVDTAQKDIKEINRQLNNLKFSTKYQFEVREVKGVNDYARILDYGKYLATTNRIDNGTFNQLMLSDVVEYDQEEAMKREDEIKLIVNRVLANNNEMYLKEFADYRNYMEYEVIVNNEEIENGRLSKLAGYNSGAGTQIPYTIILSAALALYYNARQNSTRLIFIDEPFEKMSDKNIKIMLDFFKSQSFQVIFCAPPNRLDSIGSECDAVIPIKKINKSNMTLGVIKFNESV